MTLIDKASAWLCDIPVPSPRTDSVQAFSKQETVFVELTTDDGLVGLGYSYTIGVGGTAVLELLRNYLLEGLIGADVACPEAIAGSLRRATRSTMVGPITTLAMAAIDTAVWDARGKLYNEPLWR